MNFIHAIIRNTIPAFDLQFFADAGAVVNTTVGYVNSANGNVTEFTGDKTLAPQLKTFYDTELLENAKPELVYAQFGKKQPLPAGGGETVEWRKMNTFARADKLQEGVIPSGQSYGFTTVTGKIDQYGTYVSISDRLQLRGYDNNIMVATEEMGRSAAETQEVLIRDELLTGMNVLYCDNITLATGAAAGTPTNCAAMEASSTVMSMLTSAMVNKAVTILKKNRAPKINGKYVAVIHPSVAHDLRNDEGWIEAHKYASPDQLFNGEIGELHGVRFVEDTYAPILKREGYTNKAGGATYATYFFGMDAFGMIDPEGGGLEMIVHDKSEIGGPLNQYSTIGYKFETNGATILYPERLLRVMSCSSFSATDEEN